MPRPTRRDSESRAREFARLVATDDTKLEEHCRAVGLSPWRALRLLSDPHFRALVDALDPEVRDDG